MNKIVKAFLIGLIAALALMILGARLLGKGKVEQPSATDKSGDQMVVTGPLAGKDIRFDGYYRNQVGDLIYLLRFFPEGRVVTVNGTTQVEKDLPAFLVRETKGNPGLGLHNVPVSVVGDSLVFITRPEKGEIEYRGAVVSSSMVRFLRHSHITGTRQQMEYVFYPDGSAPSKQDSTQVVQPS